MPQAENPGLYFIFGTAILAPFIVYRRTKSWPKTIAAPFITVLAWFIVGQFAHLFME